MKIGEKKAGLLCVFLHQVFPDRALEQAKFKNLGDYICIPLTPSISTPRDNSKKIILKQERISLPLMPTVVSGLKMNRPCCFPLLQKNCHNPREKKNKQTNNYQYLVLLKNSLWKRKNAPLLHAGQGRPI